MLFREDCLVLRDFCLWLLTIEREDFEGGGWGVVVVDLWLHGMIR